MSGNLSDLLEQALEDTDQKSTSEVAPSAQQELSLDLNAGLRALSERDLQTLLGALSSDELITLLTRAEPPLVARVEQTLSEDSASWVKQNLDLMGEPTEAAYRAAVQSTLQALETLAAEAKLTWPPAPPDENLISKIGTLIQLAAAEDLGPLKAALADEEPLLALGVKRLLAGDERAALGAALEAERALLEAKFRDRQEAILLAILHIRGD